MKSNLIMKKKTRSQQAEKPENKLLLICARTGLNSAQNILLAELLRKDLDWDYVLETARGHRLLPLLYKHLNNIALVSVPDSIMKELKTQVQKITSKNILLCGQLSLILKTLSDKSIPALPFKGPVLALQAYNNLALRPYDDLDIMVRKQDMKYIPDVLKKIQFVKIKPNEHEPYLHHDYYYRTNTNSLAEIHWSFVQSYWKFSLRYENLSGRLVKYKFLGNEINSLDLEDTLLIIVQHGIKHYWQRLIWLIDVAELLNSNNEIKWDVLFERADKLHIRRVISSGLLLAHNLLDAKVPDEIIKRISKEPFVKEIKDTFFETVFSHPEQRLNEYNQNVLYFRMRERLRDRIPFALFQFSFPTPKDRALIKLPKGISFLYYPLRIIKMLGAGVIHISSFLMLLKELIGITNKSSNKVINY